MISSTNGPSRSNPAHDGTSEAIEIELQKQLQHWGISPLATTANGLRLNNHPLGLQLDQRPLMQGGETTSADGGQS